MANQISKKKLLKLLKLENRCIDEVDNTDTRYLSGELKHITTNQINVRDKNGDNERYLSGELVVESKEFSIAITLDGKVIKVSRHDPRLKNGILIRYRNNMKNSYKLK